MVSPELIFLITNIGYNRSGTGLATLDAVGSHPVTSQKNPPLHYDPGSHVHMPLTPHIQFIVGVLYNLRLLAALNLVPTQVPWFHMASSLAIQNHRFIQRSNFRARQDLISSSEGMGETCTCCARNGYSNRSR
jgi:hypothetical protein